MIKIIPIQQELRQPLTVIYGNVDYTEFKDLIDRISEIIELAGLDYKVMCHAVDEAEKEALKVFDGPPEYFTGLKEKDQIHIQITARKALRCTIAKELTGLSFRKMTCRLADSPLLQQFCLLDKYGIAQIPAKSTLERYEKMIPEEFVRDLVKELNMAASEKATASQMVQRLKLEKEISLADYYLDTTCVKANMHYPVDWVLLRDATKTIMKAIKLLRKRGLKHRMADPSKFIKEMNKLCIKMTHARNAKDSKKKRKQIYRLMKKLIKKVENHGKHYKELLKERWEETDLSEKQARQIEKRLDNVLEQIPAAVHQAHERIIGERSIKNEDKILSLYDENINVLVRKKAEAMVEFGNKLLLGEQVNGLIIDWQLYKDKTPADTKLLSESLSRISDTYNCFPDNVSSDRGFFSKQNKKFLSDNKINDYLCPKSVEELRNRLEDKTFREHQTRRAQTEARIGIFKNSFLGKPLRSKGFGNRSLNVAWAVLSHNLWVLARMPIADVDKLKIPA